MKLQKLKIKNLHDVSAGYVTVCSTCLTAAIFGQDMLINIPSVADWHKIGEHKQSLTDCGNQRKNNQHIDYDYKAGDE